MLLIRPAIKNILGGGMRTWLNMAVLSFTFVLIVLYNGITDGWVQESRRETIQWETGPGQLWHSDYDRFDIFSIQEAHGVIPKKLQPAIAAHTYTPILVSLGVIYPQGRLQNVLLKGIDPEQSILNIPSKQLKSSGDEIVTLIGKRMAQAAKLKKGDRVMVRWRDRNGTFDAREVLISDVFDTKVASVDEGQLWFNLEDLRKLTSLPDEATYLIRSANGPVVSDVEGWHYKDLKFLLADLDMMLKGERIEMAIIFTVLLSIGLLALFDTQVLSIFRRQKEIGTYIALGMTPRRVAGLFTLEGTSYSILGILFGALWGTPILIWFARAGISMPEMDDMGIAIGNALYPVYEPSSVLLNVLIIVSLSALISYLPARKIAKQNVVYALKGKIS